MLCLQVFFKIRICVDIYSEDLLERNTHVAGRTETNPGAGARPHRGRLTDSCTVCHVKEEHECSL